MIKFEISENTYSRKSSNTYELSILQRMDSFVYMASDGGQTVQFLREYGLESGFDDAARRVEELETILAGDAHLRQSYRNIRIGLVTGLHSLIPNRLYNSAQRAVYLEQLTTLDGRDLELFSDDLQAVALQNVYAYPASVVGFFRKRFPGCRLLHCGSAFLRSCRALSAYLEGDQFFIHVWSRHLQILLFQDKYLQFINIFPYQSTKDVIYFVRLVVQQYQLNPEALTVHLSGQITVDTEIYRTLPRYLQQVKLLSPPAFLQIGPALRQAPAHRYVDLFSLVKGN